MNDIVVSLHDEIELFFKIIKTERWFGKEREIVSRFAFTNLLNLVKPNTKLYSPGQIGIEMRIKGVEGINKKPEVCKDLLIWKFPYQTVWSEDKAPIVIIQWKHWKKDNEPKKDLEYKEDIEFLQGYVKNHDTVGIAVKIKIREPKIGIPKEDDDYSLEAALIEKGRVVMQWILSS